MPAAASPPTATATAARTPGVAVSLAAMFITMSIPAVGSFPRSKEAAGIHDTVAATTPWSGSFTELCSSCLMLCCFEPDALPRAAAAARLARRLAIFAARLISAGDSLMAPLPHGHSSKSWVRSSSLNEAPFSVFSIRASETAASRTPVKAVATSPSPASFARLAHLSHSCAALTPDSRRRGLSRPTAAHTLTSPAAARARLGAAAAQSVWPVTIPESALLPPNDIGESWCNAETMHSSTHAAADDGPEPLSPPRVHTSSPPPNLLRFSVNVETFGANTGWRHAMSASATSRDPACGSRPGSADTNAGFAATLIRSVRSADARRFAPHASSPEATMAMDAVAAASAHAATSAADAADATASTHAASSPSYPSRSTLPAGPRSTRARSNSADATARRHVSPGTTCALDSVATVRSVATAARRRA
mmetsp:Transcript_8707/g.35618  ORF Transcript_8707/g.35618 Transcript_8707/m.35618 type:complete len:423 (-) Transcript_8707:918-2186(-)